MSATIDIRRAGAGDAERLAGVIAEAFHDLPVSPWLVPDSDERARVYPAYFRVQIETSIAQGVVYEASAGQGSGDGDGVAVWLPMTGEHHEPPADYDERLVAACGTAVDQFRALEARMAQQHPGPPHHYLALLAVHPKHQGTGLGSALLNHHHALLDAQGVPAYLEASSPRSREFYRRHGYRPHGGPLVMEDGAPPETGPAMWPMWRDPAG
jgi:GNAT superfamily N-acetyltransferase